MNSCYLNGFIVNKDVEKENIVGVSRFAPMIGDAWIEFEKTEKDREGKVVAVYSQYVGDKANKVVIGEVSKGDVPYIEVPEGNYYVVDVKSETHDSLPAKVADAWYAIKSNSELHRKYDVDFELYTGPNSAQICVGIV